MTVEPELQPSPQTQAADSSRAHASAEPHSYRRPVRWLLWGAEVKPCGMACPLGFGGFG